MWDDGRVADDDANKVVLYDWRVAFGYTGLAKLGKKRTDQWLTEILGLKQSRSLPMALRQISDAAAMAVKAYPKDKRFLAFAGIGWTHERPGNSRPVFCRVSNFHDDSGRCLPVTAESFSTQIRFLKADERFHAVATGQIVPPQLVKNLTTRMRQLLKGQATSVRTVAAMVRAVRSTALSNKWVGQSLLSVCIPQPDTKNSRRLRLGTGPSTMDHPTFEYWPADLWDGVSHGPNVVVPGRAKFLNFKTGPMEPVDPNLGGLLIENGKPRKILYPCCVFHNPLTHCLVSIFHDDLKRHDLAIFTDEDAVAAFRKKSPENFVRVVIWNEEQLIETLGWSRHIATVTLNPFSPRKGRTFSTAANGLIGLLKLALKQQTRSSALPGNRTLSKRECVA
jgi:hypothetical protein